MKFVLVGKKEESHERIERMGASVRLGAPKISLLPMLHWLHWWASQFPFWAFLLSAQTPQCILDVTFRMATNQTSQVRVTPSPSDKAFRCRSFSHVDICTAMMAWQDSRAVSHLGQRGVAMWG